MKNQIKNAEGFPILGWLVNWTTVRGFDIKRDTLTKLLVKVGIEEKIAVEVLPKNAAIRAVREHSKGKDTLHRKVADEQASMALVIAQVSTNDVFDATFNQTTKAVFDKTSRSLKVDGGSKQIIEESFENRKKVYASDQFRSIVLRYIKRECLGITYLETGNVYFVPVSKKEELRRLQNLFVEIGADVKLILKEEIDTKSVRSVMWDVTVGELKNNLKGLQEDFKGLDDEISERSLDSRLNKYKDLKTRAEMFESVLQGEAEDLKLELDKLTKLISKKVLA
jgi:hypothetical protein